MPKNKKHIENKKASKGNQQTKKETSSIDESLKFYDSLLGRDVENPNKSDNKIEEKVAEDLSEDDLELQQLRELLFGDEIKKTNAIAQNLNEVKDDVGDIREVTLDEGGFEKKLEPHLEQQVRFIRDNFSDLFGESISVSIKQQIKGSKDEVVEALYPILGSMLKRAIAKEFKLLNERIERTANQIFKFSFWKTKLRGLLTGVDHTDVFLQELYQSKIEDIFIIQKGTGLLIAKYVIEDTVIDRDIVAGALTAVKDFAESALGRNSVELEKVDYGDYAILLHNYHKFYFAVLCSGTVGNFFILDINEKILDFTEQHLSDVPDDIDSNLFKEKSEQLQKYF